MTKAENLLLTLSEECDEIGQAVSKSLRFGLNNHHPDNPSLTNERDLLIEFYHLIGVMELLQEQGIVQKLDDELVQHLIQQKKEKVLKYQQLSIELGRVEP